MHAAAICLYKTANFLDKTISYADDLIATNDLLGAALTKPLFDYKKWNSRCIQEAWQQGRKVKAIVHIAGAIFAYPLLSISVAIGSLIKATAIDALKKRNETQKEFLNSAITHIATQIQCWGDCNMRLENCLAANDRSIELVHSFSFAPDNLQKVEIEINRQVDGMSDRFQEMSWKADCDNSNKRINVQLYRLVP